MAEYSSLDRYLQARGPWLDGTGNLRGGQVNIVIGWVMLGAATLLGLSMGFSIGPGAAAAAACGPGIAGLVNLIVGSSIKRAQSKTQLQPTQVRLTDEAKQLVRRLGANMWGQRRMHSAANFGGWEPVPARQALPTDIFDLLNGAAEQANRVWGNAESIRGSHDSGLQRHAPAIFVGADEAMADVFHQAALLMRFPEASEGPRAVILQRTESLRELADRVETSRGSAVGQASTSALDSVLDELRLSQMAQMELDEGETVKQRIEGT